MAVARESLLEGLDGRGGKRRAQSAVARLLAHAKPVPCLHFDGALRTHLERCGELHVRPLAQQFIQLGELDGSRGVEVDR